MANAKLFSAELKPFYDIIIKAAEFTESAQAVLLSFVSCTGMNVSGAVAI